MFIFVCFLKCSIKSTNLYNGSIGDLLVKFMLEFLPSSNCFGENLITVGTVLSEANSGIRLIGSHIPSKFLLNAEKRGWKMREKMRL